MMFVRLMALADCGLRIADGAIRCG